MKVSSKQQCTFKVRKTNCTGAILVAYKLGVGTLDSVDNTEEKLPAHPEMTLKDHLVV
jgi:hypothetical protein